ncbi:molecular chaperone HtpG [Geothermobacter ehrlichii]|uniref:Molecular chaperone HtpG n=1 Tax=Geothermobacter ehrlichii TaxID=213224 RepID=A0A5D3WNY5_9BACT|nr:molecular chaperone HtpG [Geothermobacter ehrlichii]TYP00245.1 molecular chaperone HtpG [Geothermobacter ehrlichii]
MSEQQEKIEQGNISIHTENIFPIIKKWLYSEHDIFLRELVANAVDAIHKLKQIGTVEGLQIGDDFAVEIEMDKAAGTVTVRDNGIGMTADEIRRYINQIAFSSAKEFVSRFRDAADPNQLIGHFGLGFYSAFMVADKVEIRSLSYQEGAEGAHWVCDGSTRYELRPFAKADRGTEVILHIAKESSEFLDQERLRQVLKRYCNFLPVPIRLGGEVVNDCAPLWCRTPSEISEEEYRQFYRKLYPLAEDPLFWIHLNVDFPFNLRGIIYFPRLNNEFDVTKSHIKLFCNQVFVTDNCPELIPEFLLPLQGCLDAPDLPLNVSRSYLQKEPQVRKIREVLAGRVAARIVELAKKDRESFVDVWEMIHTFVKFGMMQDDKFRSRVEDIVLFRTTHESGHTTLKDYRERASKDQGDKIFYATDEVGQASYVRLFNSQGREVLILDAMIDSHFIQFLEMKNPSLRFIRVDAEVDASLVDEEDKAADLVSADSEKSPRELLNEFATGLFGKEGVRVRVESLKDEQLPGLLLVDERLRRFREMTRLSGRDLPDGDDEKTFLVNIGSRAGKRIVELLRSGRRDTAELALRHVYDLACLSGQAFDRERMEAFLQRSARLLELVGAAETEEG